MKRSIRTSLLAVAVSAVFAIPASAQIMTNSLPAGEALPVTWTAAAPVAPVPVNWGAEVYYTVTQPVTGLYTYWYKIIHTGNAGSQSLKSSTLDLSSSLVQVVGGEYQFGQYETAPTNGILSWAAEPVVPVDSPLRWSHLSLNFIGNTLTSGETIYLWLRSPYEPGDVVSITLQDGTIGQTRVVAPVPEPGSLLALGTGLIGLAGVLRRKA